jgi:phage-related protein
VPSSIDLAIRLSEEGASQTAADLGKVGTAASSMASDVDKAARKVDDAGGSMDKLGGHAETMDDKFGRATGSLGALSSGLELVGASGAAEALNSVAMATDFVSGAGQALMLVTESSRVATLKDAAAKLYHSTVSKLQAAGTWAVTIAQKALNVAMKANPIGLIVTAAVILIGLFVVLYKKNETFRNAVNAMGRVAKQALSVVVVWVQKISAAVTAAANWVIKKLQPVWGVVAAVVKLYIGAAKKVINGLATTVRTVVAAIGTAWTKMKTTASTIFAKLKTIITAPFTAAKNLAISVFGANGSIAALVNKLLGIVESMVNTVIRAINSAIKLINKLPGVNVGTIPEVGRSAPSTARVATAPAGRAAGTAAPTAAAASSSTVIHVHTIDPYRAATEIERLLRRRGLIVGRKPS